MAEEWITSLYLKQTYTWCPCGGWLRAGLVWPTAESWLRTMLHLSTRLESPTLLLCGAQEAKCYVGMSQESGCCSAATSCAGVSLSSKRSPGLFWWWGMIQWGRSALSLVWGNRSLLFYVSYDPLLKGQGSSPCRPLFSVVHSRCRWIFLFI